MKKFIYNPVGKNYWEDDDYNVNHFLEMFGEDLQPFFDKYEIKNAVDKNNWDYVFDCWKRPLHSKGNNVLSEEVLAFFLYLTRIDFMPYLTNPRKYRFMFGSLEEVEDD